MGNLIPESCNPISVFDILIYELLTSNKNTASLKQYYFYLIYHCKGKISKSLIC